MTAIFIVGKPGSGKTSAIKEALSRVGKPAGGFYTEEIRESGKRKGFRIVTLEGERALLSHEDFRTFRKVSRYGVDINALEEFGVMAVKRAIAESELIVIDEVGKMELLSPAFRNVVIQALMSGKKVIGTIMLAPDPFADEIKRRDDVQIVHLTRNTREEVIRRLVRWLGDEHT